MLRLSHFITQCPIYHQPSLTIRSLVPSTTALNAVVSNIIPYHHNHHGGHFMHRRLLSNNTAPSWPLPKLPVPNLNDSMQRLKMAAGTFALNQEEFTEFCQLVDDFQLSTGPKLHGLIVAKAGKTNNWLSNDWWLNKAYLEGRDPVMIWSNPGLVCPKINIPATKRSVIRYITHLLMGTLDFRTFLATGHNPESGSGPQCMNQYKKVFGSTRIPKLESDQIHMGSLKNIDPLSIIISRKGNFYRVTVKNPMNHGVEEEKENFTFLRMCLSSILFSDDSKHDASPSLGALTALPRDEWARSFTKLDKEAVTSLVESSFLLCLDHVANEEKFEQNWMENMGRHMLHADADNIGNRWFDKTTQLIVVLNDSGEKLIGSGLCYEHTPCEGGIITKMMEHAVKYSVQESATENWPEGDPRTWKPPTKVHTMSKLRFHSRDTKKELKEDIAQGMKHHQHMISGLDVRVLEFTSYGKELIKSFKLSPDSYIQTGICWTFYRLHKHLGGCYESASTRKFALGRTEAIRSVTQSLGHFTQDPTLSNMLQAIQSHKETAKRAVNGEGIDRLLLGMTTAAHEVASNKWVWGSNESEDVPTITPDDLKVMNKLYNHPLFGRSKYFKLSTSQVATVFPESFMVYGPLVYDGYGCCYNPTKDRITFGISSFNEKAAAVASDTNSDKFKECLQDTLHKMRDLAMESKPVAPKL